MSHLELVKHRLWFSHGCSAGFGICSLSFIFNITLSSIRSSPDLRLFWCKHLLIGVSKYSCPKPTQSTKRTMEIMIAVITTDFTITDNNLKVMMNERQSERSVDTMLDMHVCKIIYAHANFPVKDLM